nr:GNAT family N-acetyltransferase [Demequina sp. TTPB684]
MPAYVARVQGPAAAAARRAGSVGARHHGAVDAATEVELRLWSADDMWLLHAANTPEMTTHQGGPETESKVRARHEKYLRIVASGEARMFVVVAGGEPVGSIGWWDTTWADEPVHETGWFTRQEHQGKGYARQALRLLVEDVRARGRLPRLTAFPSVNNVPSNRLCAAAGFTWRAVESLDFRAATLTVNVWALDLGVGT